MENRLINSVSSNCHPSCMLLKVLEYKWILNQFSKDKVTIIIQISSNGLRSWIPSKSPYYRCFHLHCWRRNSGPIPPCSPILLSQEREAVNESVGGISCPPFPQMSIQLFSTSKYYILRIHCKVIVSPGNLRKSPITWGNKTIMIFTLPQCITILVFKAFPQIFWFWFF